MEWLYSDSTILDRFTITIKVRYIPYSSCTRGTRIQIYTILPFDSGYKDRIDLIKKKEVVETEEREWVLWIIYIYLRKRMEMKEKIVGGYSSNDSNRKEFHGLREDLPFGVRSFNSFIVCNSALCLSIHISIYNTRERGRGGERDKRDWDTKHYCLDDRHSLHSIRCSSFYCRSNSWNTRNMCIPFSIQESCLLGIPILIVFIDFDPLNSWIFQLMTK